jgi:DDE family transposase
MTNRTFKAGVSREQVSLLPPRVEDYVARDNPVRAIESYVEAFDLAALGFRHADRGVGEAGQPPYAPADLLKLYLYGYLNRVRSSRRLDKSAQTQLLRTDADARLLAKSGQTVAGYNVQIAVDDKHRLIVACEVVNDGNDAGQLHAMAKAAKEAVGAEKIEALADAGYYNGPALKACEEDGIVAYVPEPDRTARFEAQGRFGPEDFTYDAAADAYRCPAGEMLRPTQGRQRDNQA